MKDRQSDEKQKKNPQSGQLVLEYVLLLMLSVSMAALMTSLFIGGTAEDCQNKTAPILTQISCNITAVIRNDLPSEIN